MKTKSRIIAVLSILLLCAGLFVACSADVADSAAAEAGKTAYLDFGGASKSIDASSISQNYTIKPVSEVYWVYKATKADHAGSTGATGGAYLPVKTFAPGLAGTVGPFSVGKWTFDLIGYVGCADTQGQIPSGEDAISVTIDNVTKYYYGTIYEAHSAIITLSESTSENPQVVSVDVVFAGEGTGTVYIHEGFFYWKDDIGGDVEEDGKILKMHLTMRPTSGSAIEKYIVLDAVAYNDTIGQGYRYSPASGQDVLFVIPAGDYETDFAIEKWSTGDGAALESTLSGASNVTVKVYAKQTLKIDAQFLESVFGYVTFDGITPSPVLVQRLVLPTTNDEGIVSSTTEIKHDDLIVTYPEGTKLTAKTKQADDKKTADATTGFVYTSSEPSSGSVVVESGDAVIQYALTLNVDVANTTVLTVTKNIGTGRDIQSVYHNGSPMTIASGSGDPVADTYSYNSATGILTLYVNHASPIDVVYKPAEVTDVVASVTHNEVVTNFATFKAAVDAAQNGDTITLLKNVTLGSQKVTFNGGKSITLDLAGYTLLCGTDGHAFDIKGANLTVQNGTINGNDKQVFNVYGRTTNGEGNYSVLTIAANTEIVNAGYGICVFPASGTVGYDTEVNLIGSITGRHGIFVSGNLANASDTPDANNAMIESNVINLGNGSSISTTDQAIAMNGGATVIVVDGATLIGSEAIGLKRGTLNVTGGTLRATGDYAEPTANNNGTEASGAVVSITSTYNYARGIVANISGGTFVSANGHALAIQKTDKDFSVDALAVTVSGGTFTAGSNDNAKAVYAAEGTTTKFVSGGSFSTNPNSYVASGYEGVLNESTHYYDVNEVVEVIIKKAGYADQGMSLKTFASNVNNGETYENCIVELTRDVTLDDSWQGIGVYKSKYFKGIFDGKNNRITLSDKILFWQTSDDATIRNLIVVMSGDSNVVFCTYGMTFEDVVTEGNIVWTGSNNGAFLVYAFGDVTFTHCENRANITVKGSAEFYNAIFLGYCTYDTGTSLNFSFNNCGNTGSVLGARMAMFIGNPNNYKVSMTIDSCYNSGSISTFNPNYNFNLYAGHPSNNYTSFKVNNVEIGPLQGNFDMLPSAVNDEIINNSGTISKGSKDEIFALTRNTDNSFTVTPATSADVDYYIVSVGTYIGLTAGGSSRTYATERIEANSSSFVTTIKDLKFVDKTWVDNNPGATSGTLAGNIVYSLDGDQYYLIKEADSGKYTLNGVPTSPQMINVVAYSESGIPLTSTSLLSL